MLSGGQAYLLFVQPCHLLQLIRFLLFPCLALVGACFKLGPPLSGLLLLLSCELMAANNLQTLQIVRLKHALLSKLCIS